VTDQEYLEQEENEISLQDILRIIRKRKFWVIGVFIIVTAAVVGYLFYATPIYEAKGTLRVDASKDSSSLESILSIDSSMGSKDIATEVELIKSRRNIEDVVNELGLYEKHVRKIQEEEAEESIRDYVLRLVTRGEKGEVSIPSYQRYVSSISNMISVSTVKDTNIVSISVESSNPELAVDIVNTLSLVYNELLKEIAKQEYEARRAFIERQVPKLKADLTAAEEALRQFKEREGIFLLEDEAKLLLEKVSAYDQQISPYKIQVATLYDAVNTLQSRIQEYGGQIITLEQIRSIDEVRNLTEQLISDKLKQESIISNLGSGSGASQDLTNLRVSIANKETRLENLVANELRVLADANREVPRNYYISLAEEYNKTLIAEINISYLNQLQKNYQEQVSELPYMEQRLLELSRDVKVKENLYVIVLEKLEEARIAEAGVTGSVNIIDKAIVPENPIKPNRKMLLAIGLLLGLFLGVLAAFLIETFDATIKDEESIKRIFKASSSIIGRIPRMNVDAKVQRSELVVYNNTVAPSSEAYKTISTNILYSRVQPPQVILVTSAVPGEGKTAIAANVGIAMAQNGLKTLIINVDMRKPRLEKVFGYKKIERGLVNYILQDIPLEEAVKTPFDDLENFHIMPLGPIPPNPTALLTSERFKTMVKNLRNEYDHIILDMPPVLAVSDALITSHYSDGILMIVRAGVTAKHSLQIASDNILNAKTEVLGIVINDISFENSGGAYYYYYYYQADEGKKRRRKKKKQDSEELND